LEENWDFGIWEQLILAVKLRKDTN